MSLLRQIQDAAIDSSIDLPTLLRKCKVLAARLGNEDFKRWIDNELVGYDRKEDLLSSTLPARKWLIPLETDIKPQTTKRALRGLMGSVVSNPGPQKVTSARV